MRPDLVIFDCDGVLVDTESISNTRMAEIITEAGLPVTMEQCRKRFVGLSMRTVRERLLAEDGIDLGDDFVDRWNEDLPTVFKSGLQEVPHINTAIAAIKAAGIPMCVASSGKMEKMHLTLGLTGLLPHFSDVLFSAYQMKRGKPFPDLFLHAAERMGHNPDSCVVIEDSVPGVEAGVAAGMKVLGYVGDPLTDAGGLAESGAEVFDDMRQLPERIGLR